MNDRILLIDYGDLASLTALAVQAAPGQIVLLPSNTRASVKAMADQHASAYSIVQVIDRQMTLGDVPTGHPGLGDVATLVNAAATAIDHQCSRIVWPLLTGPDAEPVSRAVDLANTTADLMETATGHSLSFDLPVVHLTDAQLVDLVEESGAPMRLFLCCDTAAGEPCGSCDGCRRWKSAFEAAERTWPWQVSSSPS